MKSVRLDKLLANLGYGSRREIQALARGGRILLDGAEIHDAGGRIALDPDLPTRMSVDGAPLDPLPGLVLMLNKPVGVTCSHKEAGPLIYGLLPERWRRRDAPLSTIGRLDKETSGLILMTDDGALNHRVTSPKSGIGKQYRARLDRPLRGDEAETFASGTLMLEGEDTPLRPAEFEALGVSEARLVLHEGRYHQVRRMFAALGNHVVDLRRERVGGLALPEDMPAGEYRVLGPGEIAAIFPG